MVETLPIKSNTAAQPLKVASLRVANQLFALDIMCIKEIVRSLPIVRVPQSPFYIDGVINLRKAVIPIVDLRRRFGIENDPGIEKKQRIVICAVDGYVVGLLADEVREVLSVPLADVRPTPHYLSGTEAEFFAGVCRNEDQLLLLLDLRKLLGTEKPIDINQLDPTAFT